MPSIADRLTKNLRKATAVQQQLNSIIDPSSSTGMVTAPSLVTQPDVAVNPTGPTTVGANGPGLAPELEPGFLATWWPALTAIAAGAVAYFGFDMGIWWSLGIAVAALIVLYLGRKFLGG